METNSHEKVCRNFTETRHIFTCEIHVSPVKFTFHLWNSRFTCEIHAWISLHLTTHFSQTNQYFFVTSLSWGGLLEATLPDQWNRKTAPTLYYICIQPTNKRCIVCMYYVREGSRSTVNS